MINNPACDNSSCGTDEAMLTDKCPCVANCPLTKVMGVIGGKWKIAILCALKVDGPTRYNAIKKKVRGITNTMLASSLKELEAAGLVRRTQYMEMPVRVEYSLTEACDGLIPILKNLAVWGMGANVVG